MRRRAEARHALVRCHNGQMVGALQLMVQRALQVHDAVGGVHVKQLRHVPGVRLYRVRYRLIDAGIGVVRQHAQYRRAERRRLRHRDVVAVVLEFRCAIVDVLHEHGDGHFGGDARHRVGGAHNQLVAGRLLVVELVDDVDGACET